MKSISDIKRAAESYGPDIPTWYDTEVRHIKGYIQMKIPVHINDNMLSDWCDANQIPCLIYRRGEVSFHNTYHELYEVEVTR